MKTFSYGPRLSDATAAERHRIAHEIDPRAGFVNADPPTRIQSHGYLEDPQGGQADIDLVDRIIGAWAEAGVGLEVSRRAEQLERLRVKLKGVSDSRLTELHGKMVKTMEATRRLDEDERRASEAGLMQGTLESLFDGLFDGQRALNGALPSRRLLSQVLGDDTENESK